MYVIITFVLLIALLLWVAHSPDSFGCAFILLIFGFIALFICIPDVRQWSGDIVSDIVDYKSWGR